MSYRECAKSKTQCKGLKKGVKGYRACVKKEGCKAKAKPKKAPFPPPPRPSYEKKLHLATIVNKADHIEASNANSWLKHLAIFRLNNPNVKGKDVMKKAKLTYKKV